MSLLAIIPLLASFQIDAKEGWSHLKPGSFVTRKITEKQGGKEKSHTETYTLVEVLKDSVRLILGKDRNETKTLTQMFEVEGQTNKVVGKETIKAAGKSFDCVKQEVSVQGKLLRTEWVCWDAPGGVVKVVSRSSCMEKTILLHSLSEKIKVGDQEVDCWVLKSTDRPPGGGKPFGSGTIWRSSDVPGLLVKGVLISEMNGMEVAQTQIVLKFKTLIFQGDILNSSTLKSYLKCGKGLMDRFPTLRRRAEARVKNSSADAWEAKALTDKEKDSIESFAKSNGFASGQELLNVHKRVWECWKDEHTKWELSASVRSADETIKKIEDGLLKPDLSDKEKKEHERALTIAKAFREGARNPTYKPKAPLVDLAVYVKLHDRFKELAESLGASYDE